MGKIGVLICDDSALMRKVLRKIIESAPGLYVAGMARDGEDAITKARELRPDVITMDINMPGIDGITALQIIVEEAIAPVIMVSSLTQEGATATFEAMALGAFDYVGKPEGTVTKDMRTVEDELISKIKAASGKDTIKKLRRKKPDIIRKASLHQSKQINRREREAVSSDTRDFKAVAIGISTGGPKTIFEVLPFIPADLNAAIFVVQHMPTGFTSTFAKRIDSSCPLRCVEAEAGMVVEPGSIYIGKAGCHMTVYKKLTGKIILRTPTKPVHTFLPSVDIMMESVLDVFGSGTVGVLMTGMGDDGAAGMVKITANGGITIAESEESAIVYGMPREAIERGGARVVAPSWLIADEIVKAVSGT